MTFTLLPGTTRSQSLATITSKVSMISKPRNLVQQTTRKNASQSAATTTNKSTSVEVGKKMDLIVMLLQMTSGSTISKLTPGPKALNSRSLERGHQAPS